MPLGLCCEEGVEQLTDMLRIDADTGILVLNQNLFGVVRPRSDQKFAGTEAMA